MVMGAARAPCPSRRPRKSLMGAMRAPGLADRALSARTDGGDDEQHTQDIQLVIQAQASGDEARAAITAAAAATARWKRWRRPRPGMAANARKKSEGAGGAARLERARPLADGVFLAAAGVAAFFSGAGRRRKREKRGKEGRGNRGREKWGRFKLGRRRRGVLLSAALAAGGSGFCFAAGADWEAHVKLARHGEVRGGLWALRARVRRARCGGVRDGLLGVLLRRLRL